LGIRARLAAEELIDHWTVQFLSVQNARIDPNAFKKVGQAIEDYLHRSAARLTGEGKH
jgi:hypothetical protein